METTVGDDGKNPWLFQGMANRIRQVSGIQRHSLHLKAEAFLLPFQTSQIGFGVMYVSRCHVHVRNEVVFAVYRPVIQIEKTFRFPSRTM